MNEASNLVTVLVILSAPQSNLIHKLQHKLNIAVSLDGTFKYQKEGKKKKSKKTKKNKTPFLIITLVFSNQNLGI